MLADKKKAHIFAPRFRAKRGYEGAGLDKEEKVF